jgi:hypothetical protein
MSRLAWTTITLFIFHTVAGMPGTHHHVQLLVEMESHKLIPRLVLNHHPPNLSLSTKLELQV